MSGESSPANSDGTAAGVHADAAVQVFKWLIAGNGDANIREAVAEYYPREDVGAVMTRVLIGLRESAEIETDVVMGWCIESTRDLYRRMVEIGDFASSLRAVKQMAELVPKGRGSDPFKKYATPRRIATKKGK